jgi:hypothetical protein
MCHQQLLHHHYWLLQLNTVSQTTDNIIYQLEEFCNYLLERTL